MNKQEAIELLRDVAKRACYRTGRRSVHIDEIVELVNQIDEPQKVVVPEFVAEWVDETKGNCLLDAVRFSPSKIEEWLYFGGKENEKTFARAWLDGYEIEQEKLYTVEIPDPHGLYKIRYLYRDVGGNILIGGTDYTGIFLNAETRLTEAEIKQDFEWAWQFAKEVE